MTAAEAEGELGATEAGEPSVGVVIWDSMHGEAIHLVPSLTFYRIIPGNIISFGDTIFHNEIFDESSYAHAPKLLALGLVQVSLIQLESKLQAPA